MTPQLFNLVNSARNFFARHHPVIFISILGLVLAFAAFSLYQVLDITSAPASNPTTATFNKATVEKIKKLHDSTDASDALVFPTPRSNPFTE